MFLLVGRKIVSRGLDVALAFRQFFDRLDLKRRGESLSLSRRLDLNVSEDLALEDIRARAFWVRRCLQRRPYWKRGHLTLARLSLQLDEVATAYASAQAALKLNLSGRSSYEAHLVLGRACLRRGEWSRAIHILERLGASSPPDAAVTEDLAAAYLGAGSYARAAEILSHLPRAQLSAEGLAALSFARARSEGEPR